jgi:hypothetical protein
MTRFSAWWLILLGLALPGPPAAAAEPWPTVQFEVYEGSGPGFFGQVPLIEAARSAGLENTDIPLPGATPLSPGLKREMEAYLSEAAIELRRQGFPPPRIEPLVTRADGSLAYRVYFFEFGAAGLLSGKESRVALAAYGCRGQPDLRRLSFNARIAGPNGHLLRLAESTGKVPGRLDRLTDKGYGDLGHELFHGVQRNTPFFDANCFPPVWLFEGQAEAVGHDLAWKLRGIRSPLAHQQVNRWGMRPYHQPFDTAPSRPEEIINKQGYGASSLWRYLAELEKAARSAASPPPRPGAGPVTDRDAFDYGYLVRMLGDDTPAKGSQQTLEWLDGWLERDARLGRPLDRVFPDFASVFAGYWRHRLIGTTPESRRQGFLGVVFNDCEPYALDVNAPVAAPPVRLSLPAIAAGCITLERTDAGQEPVLIDVRTSLPPAAARALHMGVAGVGSAKATVAEPVKAGAPAVAHWTVLLAPGEELDLVFTNVAEAVERSEFVELDLAFAVSGWMAQGPPFDPRRQSTPQAKRRPAPAPGPRPEDSARQTLGPGAARLERELPETPARPCRWPYQDASVHCGPTMTVILKESPRWMAHQDLGLEDLPLADLEDEAAFGVLEAFVASRSADALEALDAVEVRLRLPALAFGFQGAVEHALVSVSGGGWPDSVSRGPLDVEPGRGAYFPASGRVVIEEYGPLVLRGRFEAALVANPMPQASPDAFARLPVLGEVSGRFTVGQPWAGDARYEAVPPTAADIRTSLHERLPGPLRTDAAFDLEGAMDAPAGTGAGAAGGAATGAGCDCSCAGRDRVISELEAMDEEGSAGSQQQIAKAMCLLSCSEAYAACP